MASIFKRNKRKKNEPYVIQYVDHAGVRRTEKGFTDKGLSEQLAARREDEARQRRLGLIDPVLEGFAAQKSSDLGEHLSAFERHLKRNSPKHVTLTMSRVRRLMADSDCHTLGHLEAEAVEAALADMLDEEEIGHRTYNHYLQALDSFCNWCVRTKRLIANPLVGMKRLNTEVDVRHRRRALTADEVGLLVQSARASMMSIQCFDGEQRARLYSLSYMTGLRRKEIASLTPRSFDLAGDPPTLTVEAACSKSRRKDVLPLHPEFLVELREWLAGRKPDEPLFPKLAKRRTWLMVKKDLERAGIAYITAEGIADFHAAGRHSHITGLVRNGASLPEAQKLARHSDIKMTMRYTHIGMDDKVRAIAGLPALHMRCSSDGPEGHAVSPDGTMSGGQKRQNPCGDRGFDAESHRVAKDDSVEAAGIEPASRNISTPASTCVADSFPLFSRRPPTDRVSGSLVGHSF
jgi:site-specific recombinase XerD